MLEKKLWNTITGDGLKSIPNAARGYEQRITVPEFTFWGHLGGTDTHWQHHKN